MGNGSSKIGISTWPIGQEGVKKLIRSTCKIVFDSSQDSMVKEDDAICVPASRIPTRSNGCCTGRPEAEK